MVREGMQNHFDDTTGKHGYEGNSGARIFLNTLLNWVKIIYTFISHLV